MPERHGIESAAIVAPTDIIESAVLDVTGLDELLGALSESGRTIIGPTVRDGAIVLDQVASVVDLPIGWTDEQDGGRYRLLRRDDDAFFGWAVGAHSWRQFLFPPRSRLWRAERTDDDSGPVNFQVVNGPDPALRYAFVGVRSCDIHAIAVHDRVFAEGAHPDPIYTARRDDVFIVAVHCSDPASTCFCVSMQTGPRAPGGFDLALTELTDHSRHEFLVEAGTQRGSELLQQLESRPALAADLQASADVSERATGRMGRSLDTEGIRDLLASNLEHPRWDDVAERCLACTNCTLVCPTCFCSTVEDVTDLSGRVAERWRRWDSCFTLDHSFIGGGSVRATHRDRYRQWLTHKLGTWIDQFGSSGCVGCGRCITWCPVGIDLTEEVAAIRAAPTTRTPIDRHVADPTRQPSNGRT